MFSAPADPNRLTPADLEVRRRDRPGYLLDVRTPAEYAEGHLDGADNVDVMAPEFADHVQRLDPAATYYVYCKMGGRAGRAAEMMRAMGFGEVYNAGGFEALAAAGLPVADR